MNDQTSDNNWAPMQTSIDMEDENKAFFEGKDPVLDMMARLTVITQKQSFEENSSTKKEAVK